MKRKTTEQYQIQVGAFLTIGILLAMALILVLGSKATFFQPQYELIARFDDISGLRPGAPVQLAGVTVGYVDRIAFSKSLKRTKVKIHMKIDKEFQERIRKDSEATVVTQGLLGDKMIYISVGSVGQEILKDGEYIKVKNPIGFTELFERGQQIMEETRKLVGNANRLVSHANDISQEIVKGQGLAHEVIYNRDGKQIMTSMTQVAKNLDAASGNLAGITGKINQGQGTLGALITEPSLYFDLKTLLGKANRNKLIRSVIRYTLKTKSKDQLQ